jgi:hypothetical protein
MVFFINRAGGIQTKAAKDHTMISSDLRKFVDVLLEQRAIRDADVQTFARDLLPDGANSHDVVDTLVALDRALKPTSANWAEFLVATVVDYVVWTCRPTGHVNRELATWLMSTLCVGDGPTANGMRIAFEVVREAERSDEALIAFAMNRPRPGEARDFSRSDMALLVA